MKEIDMDVSSKINYLIILNTELKPKLIHAKQFGFGAYLM